MVEDCEALTILAKIESERTHNGETSIEHRYSICSCEVSAVEIDHAVRHHWGIENSLHWVLDIVFREDECRVRKTFSAEDMFECFTKDSPILVALRARLERLRMWMSIENQKSIRSTCRNSLNLIKALWQSPKDLYDLPTES